MKQLQTKGNFLQFLEDNRGSKEFKVLAQNFLRNADVPKDDNLETIMDYMLDGEFSHRDYKELGAAHKAFMMKTYGVENTALLSSSDRRDHLDKRYPTGQVERRVMDSDGLLLPHEEESGGIQR